MTPYGDLLRRHEKNDDGFALIVVIAFLLIFSSFLGVFAVSAHIKALTGATRLSDFRLQTTAQAITALVADKLAVGQNSNKIAVNGFAHCHLGAFDVDLGIQPHSGLISLNLASEETIMTGFEALGIAADDQKALAKAVVAFRYPGGSLEEVALPPLPHGYKHAPFEDVMELTDYRQLEGIPAWKLARVFSVYASSATPSPETLSPLLRASRGTTARGPSGQMLPSSPGTVTIEATVRQGGRQYYAGAVFDIGGTATIHQVSTIPWDHLSTPPTAPDNPGLCAVAFDAKDIRLLNRDSQ